MSHVRRIALVRLSALGDVVMVLPLLHSLRHALPQVEFTWVIGEPVFPIVEGFPGVRFIPISKPRHWQDYRSLRARLYKEHFDVALCLQASLRANLIYPLLRAPIKIGYDYRRARDGQWLFTTHRIPFTRTHIVDSFLSFLDPLGITDRVIRWELPIDNEARAWARAIRGDENKARLLAVNPSASKPERNWPVDRFIDVLRAVQQQHAVKIVLTGGPGEIEKARCRQIAEGLLTPTINLCGQTNPKQLAAILTEADALLAPDTGPVHIAVAVGTPVVGLYAVAPSELTGPYQQSDGVVDCFPEAVRRILGKDPASLSWGTRVHDSAAMDLISVTAVLEKLNHALGPKG